MNIPAAAKLTIASAPDVKRSEAAKECAKGAAAGYDVGTFTMLEQPVSRDDIR
ncbi:MAG TPA: hypothetical protein VG826_28695 [Pirellulales bacterium]|nr:hypothetical protein [Pirellulales bacterium]